MRDRDLTRVAARELAALVGSGATTAEEVARAHLDRVAAHDGAFGAFQAVDRDLALADARDVDGSAERRRGPLAGVPVAVKDNFDVAGLPTRMGSAATSDRPASKDDELVRRLRAAGAVVVGKTTMPELAIWPFTESVAFGAARNPWSPDRTPGGSTGGGAIAVATGMACLALGTDGGGSIRIPAACCGVVGYKPAPGLVPLPKATAGSWFGLSASGPLARSVDDAALMLDVLAGRPPRPPLGPPRAALRIAVSTRPVLAGTRLDPEIVAAARDAAGRLAGAGHQLIDADPRYALGGVFRFTCRYLAGISEDAADLDPARLEPRSRAMARAGRVIRGLGLATPVEREPGARSAADWFRGHDLLLMPTLSSPPVRLGRFDGSWLATTLATARWVMTPAWNVVGFPAISVPVGLSKDGLPLAVQIVAPPEREELILSAAHQLGALAPAPTWSWPVTAAQAGHALPRGE